MTYWVTVVARSIIAVLVVVTLTALVASDAWWIQVFDFPRLQFSVLLLVAIAALLAFGAKKFWMWSAAGIVALIFQLYQVFPYSAIATTESADAKTCQAENSLSLLSANVLQSNTNFEKLVDFVAAEQPDVLLIMENNAAWTEALKALDADYPYQELRPQDNRYGMALYSRLPMNDTLVRDLAGESTPSIRTRISMPSGKTLTFFAVHPRPPRPGQGSGQRDAELIMLARDIKKSGRPAVIMGDFNDVGWSSSMEIFQRMGGVLDARIGRRFGASFDAKNPLMRWPLDHVFHTDDFGVVRFDLGPDIGSDHFPILATLCHNEERFLPRQDVPEPDQGTLEDAEEEMQAYDEE